MRGNAADGSTKPYGSAADLPSTASMLAQIRAMKVVTRVLAREQRAKLLAIEKQVNHNSNVVDGFYRILGPRNWIFHESVSMPMAEGLDRCRRPS